MGTGRHSLRALSGVPAFHAADTAGSNRRFAPDTADVRCHLAAPPGCAIVARLLARGAPIVIRQPRASWPISSSSRMGKSRRH